MELNTIKAITDFIFVGKEFKDLTYYDLLIINSDWAEKQLADDLKEMRAKGIINEETIFVITASHSGSFTKAEKDTSELLVNYLNDYNFKNEIIINDKYISNPEIAENIDKLVDIKKCKRILRIAKSFVARRWFITAENTNFPINKCDFYGINDGRNISKDKWFLTDDARKQVIKELVNIGNLYLEENYSLK